MKKVSLSWPITRSYTFYVTSHVPGNIMSSRRFEPLYSWVLYFIYFGKYYWFIEASKEVWKLLTAALISNLSAHTAYGGDVAETASLR